MYRKLFSDFLLIKDLVCGNDEVREGLRYLIKKAPVVDSGYGEDGVEYATSDSDFRAFFSGLMNRVSYSVSQGDRNHEKEDRLQ